MILDDGNEDKLAKIRRTRLARRDPQYLNYRNCTAFARELSSTARPQKTETRRNKSKAVAHHKNRKGTDGIETADAQGGLPIIPQVPARPLDYWH